MRTSSVLAFGVMVAGLFLLVSRHAILAVRPWTIAVQVAAVLLMLYARLTFGRRSFHAAANPTAGGIVTSGPYAFVRHPIYAAVLYFTWAAVIDHPSWVNAGGAALITAGAVARILMEERFLIDRYPEYRDYMHRTARVVPYLV